MARSVQGMTQPPPRLSERNLIAAMERHGIGTDATVADHIKKQLDRGYATKDAQVPSLLPSIFGLYYSCLASAHCIIYASYIILFTHSRPRCAHLVQALFWPTPLGEALVGGYCKMGLSNLWQPNLRCAPAALFACRACWCWRQACWCSRTGASSMPGSSSPYRSAPLHADACRRAAQGPHRAQHHRGGAGPAHQGGGAGRGGAVLPRRLHGRRAEAGSAAPRSPPALGDAAASLSLCSAAEFL